MWVSTTRCRLCWPEFTSFAVLANFSSVVTPAWNHFAITSPGTSFLSNRQIRVALLKGSFLLLISLVHPLSPHCVWPPFGPWPAMISLQNPIPP